jgi:hypothetical protein
MRDVENAQTQENIEGPYRYQKYRGSSRTRKAADLTLLRSYFANMGISIVREIFIFLPYLH